MDGTAVIFRALMLITTSELNCSYCKTISTPLTSYTWFNEFPKLRSGCPRRERVGPDVGTAVDQIEDFEQEWNVPFDLRKCIHLVSAEPGGARQDTPVHTVR
jgi:hypothetical protein